MIAYIRVSTDEQHNGPEAQRADIGAWAAREGVLVASWHVDTGVSGAAPLDRRPALLAALSKLQRGSMLVAAKRCRLARDVVAAATIERLASKAGARVSTADGVGAGDGPEAALMRTMVDAFAQYERAVIASRTRAALAVKAARGERVGGVPFGYAATADARLVEDEDEQAITRRIRSMASDGMSQRAIVDVLNDERVPARGARWHRSSVRRVLGTRTRG